MVVSFSSWSASYSPSVLLKVEGFTVLKAVGLGLSFAGTLMVGLSDEETGGAKQTVGGDLLCLFAAIM